MWPTSSPGSRSRDRWIRLRGTELVPRRGWTERCTRCGRAWALTDRRWRCSCHGLLDLQGPLDEPPSWAEWLEDATPVREVRPGLWLKMEQVLPTGSFKARGASSML